MATTKKAAAAAEEKEVKEVKAEAPAQEEEKIEYKERVRIRLPIDRNKGDALYVAVNDYSAMIKRGEWVYVPYYVALHIQECQAQEEKAEMLIEALSNDN